MPAKYLCIISSFVLDLFYFILMLTSNIILVPLEYGYVKLLQKIFLLELEFVNEWLVL